MIGIFTKHPRSMGETYFQHLSCALKFGSKMLIGGTACIIHAIFPFIFQKTGSHLLYQMMHDYIERTPSIEGRTLQLSALIEKKSQQ